MDTSHIIVHIPKHYSENQRVAIHGVIERAQNDPDNSFFGYTYEFNDQAIAPNVDKVIVHSDRNDQANLMLATDITLAAMAAAEPLDL
ncbi:hypothetical protein PuT2_11375 [Pusillimonas sp. T2]|uniref:hypothetical protein n=1 Tax=Pusillimonas sp. T2 TaxID=1548123 RepID=UPI000B9CA4E1|nr:hypothetical protein [Pusillimonas sp. T2]OXR48567.1 hypothetical protein PuT2_11375 [Pusillimonas sp. T2]